MLPVLSKDNNKHWITKWGKHMVSSNMNTASWDSYCNSGQESATDNTYLH